MLLWLIEEVEVGDEIDELSKQFTTLIEEVRNLQPPTKGSGYVKNSRIQFEDSLLAPHWRRAKLGDNELPKFCGSLPEFVDWLNSIESIFEYYHVTEETKVKLVSSRLKGRASDWWTQLKVS